MTIPEITEAEDILSMSPDADGKTFHVTLKPSETVVRLGVAFERGEHLPLVVLATDTLMVALDDVFISALSYTADPADPIASISFLAREVRLA
jgi:hypothetical protein